MAIDVGAVKKRNAKIKSNRGGGTTTWRPQSGEAGNMIRVLSFSHKVTKEDVENTFFSKEKLGKSVDDFEREIIRQFGFTENNSPVFTNKKSLALYESIKKSKDPDDIKQAKAIKPDRKFAMNIIDLNEPDKGVQLYLAPSSVREVIGDHIADDDYGPEMCVGLEARDWKIIYNKDEEPAKMYKVIISPKTGKKLGSSVQGMTKDLYDPAVYGTFAKEADDEPEAKAPAEEEAPKSNGKKSSIFDD